MSRIQELIEDAGLDVSGKWMARSKVEQLLKRAILEAAAIADTAEPFKSDDLIKAHFGVRDE
jgi:hypothetical protein